MPNTSVYKFLQKLSLEKHLKLRKKNSETIEDLNRNILKLIWITKLEWSVQV